MAQRTKWSAVLVCVVATVGVAACTGNPQTGQRSAVAPEPAAAAAVIPNGRMVTPAGRQFDLGDFPLGVAVSPDGRLAVALNAGFGSGLNDGFDSMCGTNAPQCSWAPPSLVGDPSTPAPDESLSVVDLTTGKVTDVTAVPTVRDRNHRQSNSFGLGLTFSPDGRHLYATGGGNNAVYDFGVSDGRLSPPRTAVLPSVIGANKSAPLIGTVSGYTKNVATTPDGKELLVLKEYDNDVTVLDAATLKVVEQLPLDLPIPFLGSHLYAVAVSPDGARAFISSEATGEVVVLDKTPLGWWYSGDNFGRRFVGDHPTGVAVSPDGKDVLVADANDDSVAVMDAHTLRVTQHLTVKAIPGASWGSTPNAVAFSPDGDRAYVALAGDNAVAVLRRNAGSWTVGGFLPTGWYPSAVAVRPGTGEVLAVAAKGLGSRYPADGVVPAPTTGGPAAMPTTFYYDGDNMPGLLSVIPDPGSASLADPTEVVQQNIRHATADQVRSPHNPVPAKVGDRSPIKHVIYIVRENRTFDQVFGDLGRTRSDVNADPNFEVLASSTPNAHSLLTHHATSDAFFSDGEASVQGHWWTSSANVSDYVEKGWRQNYSNRGRPSDWQFGIGQPRGCSIFQAAAVKAGKDRSFTFRDYGEATGALNLTTAKDPFGCPAIDLNYFDFTFLINGFVSTRFPTGGDDRARAQAFLDNVDVAADGRNSQHPDQSLLPSFSYITLPEDHTSGLGGGHTPRSAVAQNDEALGMIVSAISKSKYWKDTAIFVVEDDSQDGPDHVDGHRNVLLTISPWVKHTSSDGTTGGYVSHDHVDQSSVLRTIELIFGLDPLSSYDQQALPLYDLFQDKDSTEQLTPEDLAPYEMAPRPSFIDETPAEYLGTNKAALLSESSKLNLSDIDLAGPQLEAILWRSITDRTMPDELVRRLADPARTVPDADG